MVEEFPQVGNIDARRGVLGRYAGAEMNRWRLLIIAASAAAALAVGLGAQARPEPTTLQALVTAVASPLGANVQLH